MTYKDYIAWLQKEVSKYCNEDGHFEVYWDYNDSVTSEQIREAAQHSDSDVIPLDALTDILYEQSSFFHEDKFLNQIEYDMRFESDVLQEFFDEHKLNLLEDLETAGYNGIDMRVEDLLEQSSFNINVFFATPSEQNLDMGSIVAAYGNSHRSMELDLIDGEDLDNALSYLVNQQGYSVTDVYQALETGKTDSPFIQSVISEICENLSECMSELTVLLKMNGHQLLDFIEQRTHSHNSLVINKDYATIGIYNEWSGCGSMFEITPEKDVVLPMSMVRHFQIEGERSHEWSYTVDHVYGMVNSAWQSNFSYQQGVDDAIKENYASVLEELKNKPHCNEDKATPSLSLNAVIDGARQSSANVNAQTFIKEQSQERSGELR